MPGCREANLDRIWFADVPRGPLRASRQRWRASREAERVAKTLAHDPGMVQDAGLMAAMVHGPRNHIRATAGGADVELSDDY